MDDALAAMVSDLYTPLAGRVVFYDDSPPDITERQPVYAVVRATNRELGYLPPGLPTGRSVATWTLTLHGLRLDVQRMLADAPGALTAHYHYQAPEGGSTVGTLILGALATDVQQPERAERPAAVAEATITFASEVIMV